MIICKLTSISQVIRILALPALLFALFKEIREPGKSSQSFVWCISRHPFKM